MVFFKLYAHQRADARGNRDELQHDGIVEEVPLGDAQKGSAGARAPGAKQRQRADYPDDNAYQVYQLGQLHGQPFGWRM